MRPWRGRSTPGHGGEDRDLVVVVHVHVDEAVEAAVLVQDLPRHPRVLAHQALEHVPDGGGALDHDGGVPTGLGAEDGRQADGDGHGTSRSQVALVGGGAPDRGMLTVLVGILPVPARRVPCRRQYRPAQLAWAAWVSTTTDSSVIVLSTIE